MSREIQPRRIFTYNDKPPAINQPVSSSFSRDSLAAMVIAAKLIKSATQAARSSWFHEPAQIMTYKLVAAIEKEQNMFFVVDARGVKSIL